MPFSSNLSSGDEAEFGGEVPVCWNSKQDHGMGIDIGIFEHIVALHGRTMQIDCDSCIKFKLALIHGIESKYRQQMTNTLTLDFLLVESQHLHNNVDRHYYHIKADEEHAPLAREEIAVQRNEYYGREEECE